MTLRSSDTDGYVASDHPVFHRHCLNLFWVVLDCLPLFICGIECLLNWRDLIIFMKNNCSLLICSLCFFCVCPTFSLLSETLFLWWLLCCFNHHSQYRRRRAWEYKSLSIPLSMFFESQWSRWTASLFSPWGRSHRRTQKIISIAIFNVISGDEDVKCILEQREVFGLLFFRSFLASFLLYSYSWQPFFLWSFSSSCFFAAIVIPFESFSLSCFSRPHSFIALLRSDASVLRTVQSESQALQERDTWRKDTAISINQCVCHTCLLCFCVFILEDKHERTHRERTHQMRKSKGSEIVMLSFCSKLWPSLYFCLVSQERSPFFSSSSFHISLWFRARRRRQNDWEGDETEDEPTKGNESMNLRSWCHTLFLLCGLSTSQSSFFPWSSSCRQMSHSVSKCQGKRIAVFPETQNQCNRPWDMLCRQCLSHERLLCFS